MEQTIVTVQPADLQTFQNYLGNFWLMLQLQQEQLISQLKSQSNAKNIEQFGTDYQIRFMILSRNKESKITVQMEWNQEILTDCNVLLVKKNHFNLVKGITPFKIAEMVQVVNMDFQNQADPLNVSFQYINKFMMPLLGVYRNEFQKKSTSDKNSFNNIMKKVNELNFSFAQCQDMVTVPEIKLQIAPRIKEIVTAKETQKYLADPDKLSQQEISRLGQDVLKWNRDIQSLLKTQFDLMSSTTLQEQNFWQSYCNSLNNLQSQMQAEEVKLITGVLRAKNKFHLTASYDAIYLNVKKMSEKAYSINGFFKDLKLQQLMTSQSIQELGNILFPLLIQFKKISGKDYEAKRVYQLVEVLSRDLANQMLKILSRQNLMFSSFNDFKGWVEKCNDIFKKFEDGVSIYTTNKTHNYTKVISAALASNKTYYHFIPIKNRLQQLFRIRQLYQKLKTVIEDIIVRSSQKGFLTTNDIEQGYNCFKGINVLDTSKEGQEQLARAEKQFNAKIDIAQTYITKKLRQKLGASTNANEMFRIFAKFNGLFFRPRIKAAIEEYQIQLIKTVKEGIALLDTKYKQAYVDTQNMRICKARDIPQKCGSIIWAKQIRNKLQKYRDKISQILLDNWTDHPEGKECNHHIEALLRVLNTQEIMKKWDRETVTTIKGIELSRKTLLKVLKSNKNEVVVNFQPQHITLIKEIKNFQSIQPKKTTVIFTGKSLIEFYPFVVSLQESIHSYNQVSAKIDTRILKLVAEKKKSVMMCIEEGFRTNWNQNNRLVQKYSKTLAEIVLQLHQLQSLVSEKFENINSIIQSLANCPLRHEVFLQKLKSIQEIIDDFSKRQVSNLHVWVPELNITLESIFAKRVEMLIVTWVQEFIKYKEFEDDQGGVQPQFVTEGMRHEIKSENNVFFLDPPLQHAKFSWLQEFHRIIGIICSLPKLRADKYGASLTKTEKGQENYESVLFKINEIVLQDAYGQVFKTFNDAEQYIKIWFNYEALWIIDSKKIYDKLGDDINLWQKLLNEIRQNRRTFDNSQTQKYFGPIIIDYRLVLNRINTKYDSWHTEILNHFGNKFGDTLKSFFTNIATAKTKLQKINFQNLSADIVDMVTSYQAIKRKYMEWAKEVEKFDSSNKLLERQRYKYPAEWLDLDKVMIQWSNLRQVYNRKTSQLDSEMTRLQEKVISDQKGLNEKIVEIESVWNREKPNSGVDLLPKDALNVLQMLNNRINSVQENYVKCCEAKELLGLSPGDTQKLQNLKQDIQLLRQVWQHLQTIWQPYENIRETLITAVTKGKINQIQTQAVLLLNKTPTKLKSNDPYQSMKAKVNKPGGTYYLMNKKILELKEEYMKPRHWKILLTKLHIKEPQSDITFGKLWKADLNRNQPLFAEVMAVATGEAVLERILHEVKDRWVPRELELVRYQGKCNLIKGWDDMFEQLDEDLNNLSSMKLSQHYKTFEEEIVQWDQKLQKIRIILDIWIDVQRRWVYLEGIFLGSSDIKEMLVNEYTRFKGIDSEFTSLMKKVSSKPNLIETMNIQSLQKTLQRLSELLANIQKALGDYLQTQRAAFARFYFVGDQDLLEIIGNSKDVAIVQRHFTKMYAGITSLKTEKVDGNDIITKMLSRQGEIVEFRNTINVSEDPKINIWLTKVDNEMRMSLALYMEDVMGEITKVEEQKKSLNQQLLGIIEKNPAQVVLLGLQTLWSKKVDTALMNGGGQQMLQVQSYVMNFLTVLATSVVADLKKDLRQKFQQGITDFVHQRDVVRTLIKNNITSNKVFAWLYYMRMIYFPKEQDTLKKLSIQMANANFHYGFEYLGVGQKLVQTPLTDRCYLTLTQALHLRMGGAPFGPAGTGKTQSVKALGAQLGRFVLVFNCDETFDFHAMGRIFIGLCQVGAWGCFDQFNRLQERMLSACSQQILVIQTGLREKQNKIQLMGKDVKLNSQVGSFVTMNPDYAGRSQLPQNLKQLFRQMAMVKPDRQLIAQVMLYSQGYKSAEQLAGKIVSLFELCNDQLSSQPHYDFGLRALKSVLVSAGNMKREEVVALRKNGAEPNDFAPRELEEFEQKILLRSVCQTLVPKLIADDIPLLSTLLQGVFPGSSIPTIKQPQLRENLRKIGQKMFLQSEESFVSKVLQLYQIQKLHHGLMMVGPSGCGKTKAWQLLLHAMERTDKVKGQSYVIDPKAISKDQLYGKLDSTTLQWTDGVFTGVLRKITENQRGQSSKRHWIIFDGDVDPEWAENLNSVLDDNKLLTLPNGERIQIPPNVKIMFEVETLKWATLATVSRCGMVWFSEQVIAPKMIFSHYLARLKLEDYDKTAKITDDSQKKQQSQNQGIDPITIIRQRCVQSVQFLFQGDESFGERIIKAASKMPHVMQFTTIRVIESMMALIRKGISNVLEYNDSHPELPMEDSVLVKYMRKWTVQAFMWGVAGSMTLKDRGVFSVELANIIPTHEIPLPSMLGQVEGGAGVAYIFIDFEVRIEDGEWSLWKKKVPQVEIDPQKVTDADVIIPTVDTLRHQEILCSWLSEHRPFLLCGPPGSGKTMTLMSTLKALPEFEMIFVNFSSSTNPALIMKQFEHYCQYTKTVAGIILRPKQPSKWLVVFCDEINLPDTDKYGTMTVITFLRQLTEQHGFWRTSDRQWISLQRIQFVGACNPPTDIGRKPLNPRFLRHCPLILVDFPGFDSLKQIFGTFNKAMLKRSLTLRSCSDYLTCAMVQFYTQSQKHFTADNQPHYIYSPRQLTRWKYAINQAIDTIDSIDDLVRLWAHQAMRLFEDRLVLPEEKEWCERLIDSVAARNFPQLSPNALERPILFSNYLTKNYVSVDSAELKKYVEARLKIFYEEQLNVPIVVFDQVLEHILRIDRVLRQPLGHLLLVGASGVGKTTLSRFVSWLNNISVFQIKAGRNYSLHDFDQDLRSVMKRAGVKQERICFIFDQSNCLSPAFLQKMNALLASGQIPGLFEGQQYMLLLSQFKQANAKGASSDDQIYRSFIKNVQRNLHVVFTMNPNNPDFSNRTASSPALFNRCVIDWFGDWSEQGLFQVAKEFTMTIDPMVDSFENPILQDDLRHSMVINTIVGIHGTVIELNRKLAKSAKKFNYITPRDFLDFIKHFVQLYNEKKSMLEDQQFHLNVGLDKLKQTQTQVLEMQGSLDAKKSELEKKEKQASQKMTLIVQEKTRAKQKQEESQKLKVVIQAKREEITDKKTVVQADLSKAEPALIAARKNVESINKKDLDQIRGYASPPSRVQLAMKPVYLMLKKQLRPGNKDIPWNQIKAFMMKDFIKQVQQLKADDIPEAVKNHVLEKYLRSPEWNLQAITKASAAAGALAGWADSQLSYADILTKVDPMRKMIARLQEQGAKLQSQADQLASTIDQLEKKTKQLENEYENLIKEKQDIVNDMAKVEDKVGRSKNLLNNLSSEKYRWEDTSKNFKSQLASMLGDVFLSSAFLAYIGFFDHYYRKLLVGVWKNNLEVLKIKFRTDLAMIEYLSNPGERLLWRSHKLPSDDLCTQNAIIMKRYHKYPLIIDPSGQAIDYLTSQMTEKSYILSSFADDAFLKNLEKSLRFGRPLIVQDVEKIQPILNSVLNKQVYKTGGMVLIRVGDQQIDFNPNFQMFMVTRNSNARFTPDLCSRVTFVNFTITPSSLEDQCLNIFLKNERPDVEEKRLSLMKIQGEYIVKLRQLEDALLDALSNVQGSILESESVISTLEKLKTQATKITQEMKKSDDIMAEVETVTNGYKPIAQASSKIFFALQSMAGLHYLYEYSLNFFMDTVMKLLQSQERLTKINRKEYEERKNMIHSLLFQKIFQRVSNSLLSKDLLIFCLKLVSIKLPNDLNSLFTILIKPVTIIDTKLSKQLLNGILSDQQLKQIEQLQETQQFGGLVRAIEQNQAEWLSFMNAMNPQENIPTFKVQNVQSKFGKKLVNLILIKIFRPDKFSPVGYHLVKSVLGDQCSQDHTLDFKLVVSTCKAKEPILLSSAPGYDPSFKVESMSKEVSSKLISVAIGSAQGFQLADRAIKECVKSGHWVMLKNVHLAPNWLSQLQKKIHVLNPHQNFRLFLTAQFSPKIPSTLIRQSYKIVFQPADGIKASLLRTYRTVLSASRCDRLPVERSRLHFLLGWLHAVILERLRYIPIGWTKVYQFNEADQRCSLDLIDEYIDALGSRNNIDIDKIPWDAFKTILIQNLYGGKIDNEYDSKILISLVQKFFTPQSFDSTYPLYTSEDPREQALKMPDGIKYSQFLAWVEKLPDSESPAWSGLPVTVQKILKSQQTDRTLNEVYRLQDVNEQQVTLQKKKEDKQNKQVKWLAQVSDKVQKFVEILPKGITRLERTENLMSNPLFRFLQREVTVATKLLNAILKNSGDTLDLCNGQILATNVLRQLAKDIHSDSIPKSWISFTIDRTTNLTNYILDLKKRFQQFNKLIQNPSYQSSGVWFGGLLYPEAYMTATRQFVAQRNGWSLEQLQLRTEIHTKQSVNDETFLITGMRIEGGQWGNDNIIKPLGEKEDIGKGLPTMLMTWRKTESKVLREDQMMIPVYLNRTRKNLIMSLRVNCGKNKTILYQKGIAIIAWTL